MKINSLLLSIIIFIGNLYADDIKNIESENSQLVGFNMKLTNISYQTNFFNSANMLADPAVNSYLLGTVSITILPSTWNIDLSYTGQISKDALYESKSRSGKDVSSYRYDEGESDFQHITIYTKPINTNYGSFGIGFDQVRQNEIMMGPNNGPNVIVDIPNPGSGNARYEVEYDSIYMTYNIPSKNKWYSGFGVSYGIGNTNQSVITKNENDIALKPDTNFKEFAVGINKTFDEVNSGLSFKTLTITKRQSDIKYFNKFISQEEKFSREYTGFDMDIIYMYKWKKNKKLYTSFKFSHVEGDFEEYDEMLFELGLKY